MLNQAQGASTATAHAAIYEQLRIKNSEYYLDKTTGKYNGSLIEYLQNEKDVINQVDGVEGYIVDVVELMRGKQKYGNGTDGKTDVYKIEEEASPTAKLQKVASTNNLQLAKEETENKIYDVYYYVNEDNKLLLGTLNEQSSTKEDEEAIENLETFEIWYNSEENQFELNYGFMQYVFVNKMLDELELTDEELIVFYENKVNGNNFSTFEEVVEYYVSNGRLQEGASAQDYFEKVEYSSNREEFILNNAYEFRMDICDEEGNPLYDDTIISEPGEYVYTINIEDLQEYKVKITIDRYEPVTLEYGDYIGVYDFKEKKWLSVGSGKWKDHFGTNTEENIPNELIILGSEEDSYYDYLGDNKIINVRRFSKFYFELNLMTPEGTNVKGYVWLDYRPM